jgi:hypothetical protein
MIVQHHKVASRGVRTLDEDLAHTRNAAIIVIGRHGLRHPAVTLGPLAMGAARARRALRELHLGSIPTAHRRRVPCAIERAEQQAGKQQEKDDATQRKRPDSRGNSLDHLLRTITHFRMRNNADGLGPHIGVGVRGRANRGGGTWRKIDSSVIQAGDDSPREESLSTTFGEPMVRPQQTLLPSTTRLTGCSSQQRGSVAPCCVAF